MKFSASFTALLALVSYAAAQSSEWGQCKLTLYSG
jgi:hypothetical protein